MQFDTAVLEEIADHAREDLPNECCGMIAGKNGRATSVYRARNAFESPLRYRVDDRDLFRIVERDIPDADEELVGIYHSHPGSEAYPSQTDINLADGWPDPLYLICSLADPENPVTRAFAIRDGGVAEVELAVG
jgi:proteasome lid subunit RPN8/RPN11